MNRETSSRLFSRAVELLPGGVNSPVRAFRAVGSNPVFFRSASGAKMTDADGNEYIDYIGSWGPFILGHRHPRVEEALREQLGRAFSFGAPTELELQVAELIIQCVPSIEMVRMVNSGTEAAMAAIRLARAFTGRDKIVKFEGCYHGHGDSFLIKAGSGVATLGLPDSPGVTKSVAQDTLTARYNDLESVEVLVKAASGQIAAIVLEPVVGNMGCVIPEPGFLEGLRSICDREGMLLIFDEVMTGFRVALGGAQQRFNIMPDITVLGKIVGGGLPVGAYGGRKDIMKMVAPSGPMYQAGTLSGNPLAMVAGYETISILAEDPSLYDRLETLGARLEAGLRAAFSEAGVPVIVNRVGSMLTAFFTSNPVRNWEGAAACDKEAFGRFFRNMLDRGVYLPPSQFEAAFFCVMHTEEDIDRTIAAARESLK